MALSEGKMKGGIHHKHLEETAALQKNVGMSSTNTLLSSLHPEFDL